MPLLKEELTTESEEMIRSHINFFYEKFRLLILLLSTCEDAIKAKLLIYGYNESKYLLLSEIKPHWRTLKVELKREIIELVVRFHEGSTKCSEAELDTLFEFLLKRGNFFKTTGFTFNRVSSSEWFLHSLNDDVKAIVDRNNGEQLSDLLQKIINKSEKENIVG